MTFKGKRSGIVHKYAMDVISRYRFIKKFRGGVPCYMMESEDFTSNISFRLKNKIGRLISFNGQSFTFKLSIEEI